MRAGVLPIVLVALGGCSLFLSTDDLAGEGAASNPNDGGGGGDGTPSTDGELPAADAGGDAGTDAGKASKFGPLTYIVAQDAVKTRVDGFFELRFPNNRNKHLGEWADLAIGNAQNVGGTPVIYQAPRAFVAGTWCEDSATSDGAGSSGVVDIFDGTPVYASFNTFVHHTLTGGIDVKRWARFTVHATGRVVVESALANGSSNTTITADAWTYHDVQLSQQISWQRTELANKSAYAFFPKNGGTSLTMINQAGETSTEGANHDVRWTMGAVTLAPTDKTTKLGEIQLGATMLDVTDRVNDVRNPAVEVIEGGNGAGSTYVLATGIYVIPATSGTLKFSLGPTRTRYYPTVTIENFTSPNNAWKVTLDGVVIASAQAPITEHGVAKFEALKGELAFSYFGVVLANVSAEKRTFVVER